MIINIRLWCLLILFSLSGSISLEASESQCSYYNPVLEYYSSDYVFIGKVVKSEDTLDTNQNSTGRLTFQVNQFLKNDNYSERIFDKVLNRSEINFEQIKDYLVYIVVEKEDKALKPCTRTRVLGEAEEDLSEIGKLASIDSELKISALTGKAVGGDHDTKLSEIRSLMQ